MVSLEERYRFLVQEMGDVVALDDADGRPVWVSPSLERVLGWTPEQVVAGEVLLFHPDDLPVAREMLARLTSSADAARGRIRMRHRDGGYRWTDSVARAVRGGDGSVRGFIVVTRDVDEQVRAEQHRAETEEAARIDRTVLRGVMDAMLDPLVLLAAARDSDDALVDLVCVDANPAAERALGLPRRDLLGATLLTMVPGPDGTALLARLGDVVDGRGPLVVDGARYVGPRPPGERILVDVRAVRVGDGVSVTWRDVTAAHAAAERLQFLAAHDPLTALANRHEVMRRLAAVLGHPPRAGTGVAVLYLDLDGLKPLNDTYGHALGDAVLVEVGRRLAAAVRAEDLVARIGGDEFLVALTEVAAPEDAHLVAAKIHRAIAAPFDVEGHRLSVTVSIGIAHAEPGDDVDGVVSAADQALYDAKRAGRNRTATAGARPARPH